MVQMRNNCILCLPFALFNLRQLTWRASSPVGNSNEQTFLLFKPFQLEWVHEICLLKRKHECQKWVKFVDVNKHFNKLFFHCLEANKFPSFPSLRSRKRERKRKNSWALKFTSENIFNLLHTINHSWYSREQRNEIKFLVPLAKREEIYLSFF